MNPSNCPTTPASHRRCIAALLLAACTLPSQALEFTAGDYEQLPAGVNVGLLYLQHAQRDTLYSGGAAVSQDFRLTSDVALLRYIHVLKLGSATTFDANLILPLGRLHAGGAAATLGNASGAGDVVTGGAFKFLLDPQTRDVVSIAPFLTLPTGRYEPAQALNIGENRWKLLLQAVYVRHLSDRWAMDLGVDATRFGDNTAYGAAGARLSTALRTEAQVHVRYNVSAATAFSVGLGRINGAENRVGGIPQGDRLGTTYARLTAAQFVGPATQWQVQLGQDLKTQSGPREKVRLNLRVMQLF